MIQNEEKEIITSIKTMKKVLNLVREGNDMTISATSRLETLLLNLKIEKAKINGNNGISPIADALEKIILELHSGMTTLIKGHRQELLDSVDNVIEYIKEKEEIKDDI